MSLIDNRIIQTIAELKKAKELYDEADEFDFGDQHEALQYVERLLYGRQQDLGCELMNLSMQAVKEKKEESCG